jgi:nucleoside-diphosphate-sugar epimerase
MVATRDIGQVAARRLLDLNFSGKNVEYILGQRDVSYNEVARIVGAAIGKADLPYVQFPYDQAQEAMSKFLSADYARRLVAMAKDMNEGEMLSDCKRTPENTTPTSIEEFAQWFAAAYNAPASAN